ncbi:hypothetical protein [Hymenobacter sp. CRA2]|uniref:hypothetical protein n=1 Tax=Hymenobacter sp. CRA2 TaxID=1955620 RepID=UPI001115C02F|nr:hypothetical protein [Hymenobacter sp. CRA2]
MKNIKNLNIFNEANYPIDNISKINHADLFKALISNKKGPTQGKTEFFQNIQSSVGFISSIPKIIDAANQEIDRQIEGILKDFKNAQDSVIEDINELISASHEDNSIVKTNEEIKFITNITSTAKARQEIASNKLENQKLNDIHIRFILPLVKTIENYANYNFTPNTLITSVSVMASYYYKLEVFSETKIEHLTNIASRLTKAYKEIKDASEYFKPL